MVCDHGRVRILGDSSGRLAEIRCPGGTLLMTGGGGGFQEGGGGDHIMKGQGYSKTTSTSDPTQSVRILDVYACRIVPRRHPRCSAWRNDRLRRCHLRVPCTSNTTFVAGFSRVGLMCLGIDVTDQLGLGVRVAAGDTVSQA